MTFWEHFIRVLRHKPLPALAALYWHVTRRRVRARNRLRVASADLPFIYAIWIDENERIDVAEDRLRKTADWSWRPRFSVMVLATDVAAEDELRRSRASVEEQIYPEWQLIEAPAWINAAITRATGDFLIIIRAGNALSRSALLRFAEALHANPDAGILYGDQDHLSPKAERFDPWFKPQWNEEMFLAQDYISAAAAIRTSLAAQALAAGAVDLHSLFLSATAATNSIVHVPHITLHVSGDADDQTGRLACVSKHLEPKGAICQRGRFGTTKVQWPLAEELPLVSVVIPTRDKVDVLRPCVQSLLERTDYQNLEILIIDNGSTEHNTVRYLAELSNIDKIRVIPYNEPFNYSAINNFAVRHAKGSYLCLLNNDTEVIQAEWLTELMRYAVRPNIGAAGPMLLYDDHTIQHAGVVVGIGEAAGHAHRFLPADQPGYFRMPHISQFVSAVTGACLVVERSKFERVGGLDEQNLAIAFNDVDLCLKLEASGLRNVYVPHAVLIHHESKSRGKDFAPAHVERYHRELKVLQERWGTKTYQDPLHNPNLHRYSESYVLRV